MLSQETINRNIAALLGDMDGAEQMADYLDKTLFWLVGYALEDETMSGATHMSNVIYFVRELRDCFTKKNV